VSIGEEASCTLFGTEEAQVDLWADDKDWHLSHLLVLAALGIEVVQEGIRVLQVVQDTCCDTTSQIDTAIRKAFQCHVTNLNCENLSELLNDTHT
jgi:hypothetical protein